MRKNIKAPEWLRRARRLPSHIQVIIYLILTLVWTCGFMTSGAFCSITQGEIAGASLTHTASEQAFVIATQNKSDLTTINHGSDYAYYWRSIYDISESALCYLGATNAEKKIETYLSDDPRKETFTFLCQDVFVCLDKEGYYYDPYYMLDLMFYGVRDAYGRFSFLYILESQAKVLLGKQPEDDCSEAEYRSLIGEPVTLNLAGKQEQWTIGNIIIESRPRCQAILAEIGSFAVTKYKMPNDYPYESVFFASRWDYINKRIVQHLKEAYDSNSFSFTITNAQKTSFAATEEMLQKYLKDTFIQPAFFVLFFFGAIGAVCSAGMITRVIRKAPIWMEIVILGSPLVVYGFWWIAFLINKSILFFSTLGCIFLIVAYMILATTRLISIVHRGYHEVGREL